MYGHQSIIRTPRRRNILAFSDLQYSRKVSPRKLDFLLQEFQHAAKTYNIDYFFFLGDLINSLDEIKNHTKRAILIQWLRRLTQITPLIMISGNHDYSYHGQYIQASTIYRGWCDTLRSIPNLHLLEIDPETNSQYIFDDGNIRVLGLTLPEECYPTNMNSNRNGTDAYIQQLQQFLPGLQTVQERDHYLLVHSPRHLDAVPLDINIFALAGHSHNGLIPPVLDELLRSSTRGLVAPGHKISRTRSIKYELFAPNSRLQPTIKRPIATIKPCTYFSVTSHLGFFNHFYPSINYSVIIDSDSAPFLQESYFLPLKSRYK